jgi:hypothetical protein
MFAEDDGPLDSGKAAREPIMDCSTTTVSMGLVTGQLASDRPYDQSPGEALARTGVTRQSGRAGFRAATYQKLKVAEKHRPLSGPMHASPYIIVEEQWTTL